VVRVTIGGLDSQEWLSGQVAWVVRESVLGDQNG
jgi:hypothetical protein